MAGLNDIFNVLSPAHWSGELEKLRLSPDQKEMIATVDASSAAESKNLAQRAGENALNFAGGGRIYGVVEGAHNVKELHKTAIEMGSGEMPGMVHGHMQIGDQKFEVWADASKASDPDGRDANDTIIYTDPMHPASWNKENYDAAMQQLENHALGQVHDFIGNGGNYDAKMDAFINSIPDKVSAAEPAQASETELADAGPDVAETLPQKFTI